MSRIGNLSTRIFVGGLDPAVDEADLERAFALFGEITNAMVMRDRENGRSRGFAFISFKNSQSSEEAISRMHGVEIRGRCVTVRHAERERFADDKPQQPSRGGSTRGRGGFKNTRSAYGLEHGGAGAGGGRRWKVSETVFVTEDDNDRYRDRSPIVQRRPVSPKDRDWGRYGGEKTGRYRDQSPRPGRDSRHGRDEGYTRQGERSYQGDRQYDTVDRLSPTRELTAYINARGRSYSPLLNLTKKIGADEDTRLGRSQPVSRVEYQSYTDYSSTKQDRQQFQTESYGSQYSGTRGYDHDRQSMREKRSSPESFRRTSPRPSRSDDSYGRLLHDAKRVAPTNRSGPTSDLRKDRRVSPRRRSPLQDRRTDAYGDRSALGDDDSWGRKNRQRSPISRQSCWNRDSERMTKDVSRRGGRVQQNSFRDNSRADFASNGKNSALQSSWTRRDNRDDSYRQQDKDRTSDQTWRRGTHNKNFGAKRETGRSDEFRGGTGYRGNRYGGGDKGGRGTGSFRNTSPFRGRPDRGSGNRQYSSARRY